MKNNTVIQRILLVVAIVLAAIAYLAWFSHQSSREIGMLNQLWREHSVKVNEKRQLLHEVKTRLGYNGFIHNFKNYVIRRDIRYLNRAKNQLQSGLHIIDEYKQLDMRPIELANVDRLQGVIQNYQQKVTAIQHDEVVNLSVAEFDRLVKVDDSPAIGALEDITSNIYTEHLRVKRQTDSLIEIIEYRMGILMYVGIPFLILILMALLIFLLNASRSARNLSNLIRLLPDGFLLCDAEGNILQTNNRSCELFGYSKHEMENMVIEDLLPHDFKHAHVQLRSGFISKPQMRAMKSGIDGIRGLHRNGDLIPLEIAISSAKFGRTDYGIALVRDKRIELELKRKSETDFLTGVYNRLGINRLMVTEIDRAKRYDRVLSLMVVDIDNFKAINDTHGHLAGDAIIAVVADAFKKGSRPMDIIGRWGGDEFCVICPETDAEEALEFANRISASIKKLSAIQPLIGNKEITLSIGIAQMNLEDDTVDSLFSRADEAVYESKAQGKDQAHIRY